MVTTTEAIRTALAATTHLTQNGPGVRRRADGSTSAGVPDQ